MKRQFFLLFLLSFTLTSYGQIKESKAIDSLFLEWNKPETPGCAIGIVKDGELIYSNGYGIADLEHDIEITPSSVFYIGSVSKQFVTFSILLLEEQGKLDLDDRIQKYLPDFPDYNSNLTIRNFIHHTSGVRDYLTLMYLKGRNYLDNADVDEVYELIKKQKELNFIPGDKYLYSNSCYFMLAMIIEKAAGQSLKDFAHENIFQPLGMKNSLFYDDNTDLIKNRVFSYEKKNNEDGFNNLIMRFDLVGSGGVYSSIEDLFLWDQNFYNNKLGKGGQTIIDKMHEEGLLNNGESSGYAFALNNGTYKGLKTVSHGGALAGYRAQLMRFPDEKFSVIVLANRGDANPTAKSFQIADILLKERFVEKSENKEIKTEKPKDITSLEKFNLNQLVGNYEIQAGMVLEITLKNDSVNVLQTWNKSSYNITNTTGNTYEILNDNSIQFVFSELKDDYTQTLTVFQNGNETICKRKKQLDLSSLNMEDYTGNYYSEELDVSYLLFMEEGTLKVKVANNDPLELKLYDIDAFTSDGNLVRFNRVNGIVRGFELDAGRVTNLKFEKK
ncbi:serine hydrolase domain-containing protein [Pareuzebyella sediminis]|uniref:serine hydrolase domain-containing protein n=1 Tax=Pareuzebyella sediminis TaxID=2607998 RepID=UPI0011EDAEE2|nr:serine hydrolase domain-containing protein [Pareuzebyella sediminis]